MKTPSRTLVNWIAMGLIVLFACVLLSAVIAPRLPGSGGQAENAPGLDETATALYAPTPTALYWSLPAGALITAEQIGLIPAETRVRVSHATYTPDGWVYSIVTLDGSMMADAHESQVRLDPAYDPAAPTPAPRYEDSAYWSACYPLVLLEDVPVDPSLENTTMLTSGMRVRISSYTVEPIYVEGHGYVYQYQVAAKADLTLPDSPMNQISATVYEYQISLSPDVQVVEGAPTAASPFEIGMYGAGVITTEDIGGIPAGSSVTIGSAYFSCDIWVYDITSADGQYAQAREDQLMDDPNFTPGPTPTYPDATATLPADGVIAQTIGDPVTRLRSAPTVGEDNIVGEVPVGTQLVVLGRWLGYDWYLVRWEGSSTGEAWVHASLVMIIGDETLLPAVEPPITPVPTP